MVPGHRDVAAGLPRTRAGHIKGTAHAHRPALHVTHQPDRAIVVLKRARPNDTGVVHGALQQTPCRARTQEHLAAVSAYQATVLCQRIHGALVDRDVEQAVAGHVKGHGISGGKRHRSQPGRDHAVVGDIGAEQGHIATVSMDGSLIQDRGAAGTREVVPARHEVAVGDIQRRGHKSAHIDRCALTEQDAVRIDQEHLAVGRQRAQDARRISAQHPVECNRVGIGLQEQDRFPRPDAEALPVDGGILCRLRDGGGASRTGNAGAAGRHNTALRQGVSRCAKADRQAEHQRLQGEVRRVGSGTCAGRCLLSTTGGVLGGRHKGACLFIPD